MLLADFFIHALIAGLILAFVAAPLGCFVVWRSMSYFGDAIAHSALLGLVLGLCWQLPLTTSITIVAIIVALLLTRMQRGTSFSTDTLLGILSHLSLALGIVILSLVDGIQIDLMAYLFGDILAVSADDLLAMYVLAAVIVLLLWIKWRNFILVTLNEDIAKIQGINIERYRLLLMLMIALTVALSIKLVGLLLITAMLIIPAATARYYSSNPAQMAIVAVVLACLSVIGGLFGSLVWDTASGASIVLMAGFLFAVAYLSYGFTQLRRKWRASS